MNWIGEYTSFSQTSLYLEPDLRADVRHINKTLFDFNTKYPSHSNEWIIYYYCLKVINNIIKIISINMDNYGKVISLNYLENIPHGYRVFQVGNAQPNSLQNEKMCLIYIFDCGT